jgi:hypothetical protein
MGAVYPATESPVAFWTWVFKLHLLLLQPAEASLVLFELHLQILQLRVGLELLRHPVLRLVVFRLQGLEAGFDLRDLSYATHSLVVGQRSK